MSNNKITADETGSGGLKSIWWIFIKEMHSFFGSNLPPFSLGIFAVLSGLVSVLIGLSPSVTYEDITRALFYFFYIIIIIISIFLSMSSIVNERKQGTLELLRTLPLSDTELVLGKFLPGVLYVSVMSLSVCLVYVMWIAEGPAYMAFAAFPGLMLAGLFAYSVGIFASCIAENHLISLLIASGIIIAIEVGGFLGGLLPEPAKSIISHMHAISQYAPFTRGVIPLRGLIYFSSLISLFIFFSIKVLESRRWRSNDF